MDIEKLLNTKINLITTDKIRYEGILKAYSEDLFELLEVKSHGTEDRETDTPFMPIVSIYPSFSLYRNQVVAIYPTNDPRVRIHFNQNTKMISDKEKTIFDFKFDISITNTERVNKSVEKTNSSTIKQVKIADKTSNKYGERRIDPQNSQTSTKTLNVPIGSATQNQKATTERKCESQNNQTVPSGNLNLKTTYVAVDSTSARTNPPHQTMSALIPKANVKNDSMQQKAQDEAQLKPMPTIKEDLYKSNESIYSDSFYYSDKLEDEILNEKKCKQCIPVNHINEFKKSTQYESLDESSDCDSQNMSYYAADEYFSNLKNKCTLKEIALKNEITAHFTPIKDKIYMEKTKCLAALKNGEDLHSKIVNTKNSIQ